MFFLEPFKILYRNRRMLKALTFDDIKKKYAGSILGIAWLFLYPMLFLAAYAFVYSVVLNVRLGVMTSEEYILLIFSGLLPFLAFSETMGASVASITSNSALIKNTLVPIDIMPVKAALFSQCTQIVGGGLLLAALAVFQKLTPYALIAVYVWLCQMLFCMGAAWFLAAFCVYFRDLQTIVPLLTILLMFVSPIAYTADMVPGSLRFVMNFNPLYYFIAAYQDALVLGRFPAWDVLLLMTLIALAAFFVGYWLFRKTKMVLADNI